MKTDETHNYLKAPPGMRYIWGLGLFSFLIIFCIYATYSVLIYSADAQYMIGNTEYFALLADTTHSLCFVSLCLLFAYHLGSGISNILGGYHYIDLELWDQDTNDIGETFEQFIRKFIRKVCEGMISSISALISVNLLGIFDPFANIPETAYAVFLGNNIMTIIAFDLLSYCIMLALTPVILSIYRNYKNKRQNHET